MTPTTWTINGVATLTIPQNQQAFFYVDPNSSTNWVAEHGASCLLAMPVFNVAGYGATGNGTTDDSAAIEAAINAAAVSSGVVYFPQSSNPYSVCSTQYASFWSLSGGCWAYLPL